MDEVLNLRLTGDLKDTLREMARNEHRSLSNYAMTILERHAREHGRKRGRG